MIITNLHYALLGLICLLLLASFLVIVKKRLLPSINDGEIALRLRSWWVIIFLVVCALAVNTFTAMLLMALVSFLALKEFYCLIHVRHFDTTICKISYVIIPLQYGLVLASQAQAMQFFIPIGVFIFLLAYMTVQGQAQGFLNAVSGYYIGIVLTVFLLSHTIYLFNLPIEKLPAGGVALLFYLIFLTQLNDVMQYIWGKLLGRQNQLLSLKISPLISPNKTLAGLLGGVITTTLLAVIIAPYLTPFNVTQSICAGLIMSVGGFIGDVIMSAIKRDVGVKNAGALIPGHGGMLDRVDSLIITAPMFYYWMIFI